MSKLHIVDTTLRDGSHAISHSFTVDQVKQVAGGLDKCGVDFIEISHGDGIAGSSYNYGFSAVDELELLEAANEVVRNAKLTVLLLPGIGTVEDLERARERGASAVRVATHVTEADISAQHIAVAKKMDMFTVGFLMMCHMSEPAKIAEQARMMEGYGADYINLADSAGYLLPEGVAQRIESVKSAVKIPVGFHAHNNLGLAIANSLAAVDAGAEYVDATLRGLGAGAGNAQIEVLAGVLQRMNKDTGLDFYGLMDLAEDVLEPLMHRPQTIKTGSLMLGYAGVYSSFLLHVYRAGERFGIEPRDILVELGRRRMVGGQEDMIIDVAYQLSQANVSH
ncbi:MAG: 4-hydroxy-2-oxovalerate aldolase [Oscillospiraceae bacterium]|nr:4-hydroxy-2-oxovalerate aldolase [Oscillospiraceae bacterium]